MKAKLLKIKNALLESFSFIPLLLIFFAFLLAIFSLYIDKNIATKELVKLSFFSNYFSGSVEWYRAILSTIWSSMMTIAGIVFSTTLVALTMTASQFWSKIIKSFIKNKLNQFVLWAYIATFTYCLIILRFVRPEKYLAFNPDISVFIAIILWVSNIILLIFFINNTAKSLQADNIISRIWTELLEKIEKQFPNEDFNRKKLKSKESEFKKCNQKIKIIFEKSGYINWFDVEKLEKIAKKNNIIIQIERKIWDFLIEWENIWNIYLENNNYISDEVLDEIKKSISIFKQESNTENINFSIKQLSEISLRALSPWINDSHTAMSCVDIFSNVAKKLLEKKNNTNLVYDENWNLKLEIFRFDMEDFVADVFWVIRQYSKNAPDILKHLHISLEKIIEIWKRIEAEEVEIFEKELELLKETIKENIAQKHDRKFLKD